MYIHTYAICKYVYMHICINAYMYVCMYTCMYLSLSAVPSGGSSELGHEGVQRHETAHRKTEK